MSRGCHRCGAAEGEMHRHGCKETRGHSLRVLSEHLRNARCHHCAEPFWASAENELLAEMNCPVCGTPNVVMHALERYGSGWEPPVKGPVQAALAPENKEPTRMRTADEVFAQAAAPGASPETRKNGKVRMELVVEGFPHLMHALGRMMTWAAVEKEYEPHDWKKYDQSIFLAALARHQNKRLRGEKVDDESGLPHLIHEAFNIMAAAEVALMEAVNAKSDP